MTDNDLKFTPGPWKASENHDEVYGDGSWFQTEDFSVINVKGDYISSDISSRENMYLIAQAPSLYTDERKNVKFLGGLRDFFASMVEDPPTPDFAEAAQIWVEEINRRMAETTELLAKARGESND